MTSLRRGRALFVAALLFALVAGVVLLATGVVDKGARSGETSALSTAQRQDGNETGGDDEDPVGRRVIQQRAGLPASALPETPAEAEQSYVFPVRGCRTTYARTHHDYPAADIFGDGDCRFVAPLDGRVEHVARVDRWDPATNEGATRGGLSVALVGVDGVRYYGSHLADVLPGIREGRRVEAGQPLGKLGESGSARGTGTHLHFGISWPTSQGKWWIRRGTVAPQPYLDAWRAGRDRAPAPEVAKVRRASGEATRCARYC
jgi:peptidoglycan LD-endopeptidase LytH